VISSGFERGERERSYRQHVYCAGREVAIFTSHVGCKSVLTLRHERQYASAATRLVLIHYKLYLNDIFVIFYCVA